MARVQNTLIGRSSGSVGGATFSTWKGINVLKAKAEVVANPQTIPQLTQRNRMTVMVAVYRLIAGIIQTGYKTLAIGKSEYNAFISDNIIDATTVGVAPAVTFTPSALSIAKGTMGVTPIDLATGTNASANIPVTWDDALAPIGSSPNDEAYVAVYNITQDNWGFAVAPTLRSTGTITAVMPTPWVTGNSIQAYLFFKSATSEEVSDSQTLLNEP